jgi:hypothetical protein
LAPHRRAHGGVSASSLGRRTRLVNQAANRANAAR